MARPKGIPAWNKGIKRYWDSPAEFKKNEPRISGKNAYQWKGENVGYRGLHRWVAKLKGKATTCEFCGKIGTGKQVGWANKSGEYKRELSDWISLCGSCHNKYDDIHTKMWITRRSKLCL